MMAVRILRSDAPAIAQVTRIHRPDGQGEIVLTILGSGKFLTFAEWSASAIAAAWNASTWPEFAEAKASVSGSDVLLTSKVAGRPFYVSATRGGGSFGNEVQIITAVGHVTGGTSVAVWLGESTDAFDPTATTGADFKDLFEALPGGIVEADELAWTGAAGGPWTVEFKGRYAEQDVPLISFDNGSLTGGTAARNEIERLFLAADTVCTFALRRADTLGTTVNITTPCTADDVESALDGVGYTTHCTGGELGGGGGGTAFATPGSADGRYAQPNGFNPTGSFNVTSASTLIGTVDYGDGAGPITVHNVYPFTLAAPQGATINSALLTLTVGGNVLSQNVTGIAHVEASDDASPVTSSSDALSRSFAGATQPFVIVGAPGSVTTIDVTSLVQAAVNRAGWHSGNTLQIHLRADASNTGLAVPYMSEHGSAAPTLEVTSDSDNSPITIEWIDADAEINIPQLIVVPVGGYTNGPTITTIQDGAPAAAPKLVATTFMPGGEAIVIRDDVRSRGPNHYDDPLNWDCDDGSFQVPGWGDRVFLESGSVDLLYGLNQRSRFVAIPNLNKLRLIDIHHLWVGQAVRIITTGTLPGGMSSSTTYYVVSIDGPYVQLATAVDGDPVDITSAGTGVHTLGVKLEYLEQQARWTGKLGLPRQNKTGSLYFEYRETYLSVWCDLWKIGRGNGGGTSRFNLDTGTLPTIGQAIASAGQSVTGVNAVLWKGDNAQNEIEALGADIGLALFPEETATIDILRQRSGSVTLGRGLHGNEIDATGGTRNNLGATFDGPMDWN